MDSSSAAKERLELGELYGERTAAADADAVVDGAACVDAVRRGDVRCVELLVVADVAVRADGAIDALLTDCAVALGRERVANCAIGVKHRRCR